MFTLYTNTDYLDILLLITSIIAAGFPIIVFLDSKRNKVNRAKKLIDLLDYRSRVNELILKESSAKSASPNIKEKLNELLLDIDKDFKIKSKKISVPNIWLFIIVISIEIFFVFNKLRSIIELKSYENKKYYLEGIFEFPVVKLVGLLIIFFISFTFSYRLTYQLKGKYSIKNDIILSLILILIFNILISVLMIFIDFALKSTDHYITWF